MGVIQAVRQIFRENSVPEALRILIAAAYKRTAEYLPSSDETVTYNGVAVKRRSVLDRYAPEWMVEPNLPEYEPNYVPLVRRYVQAGDDVVIVGGGAGVSTVVAATEAGPQGEVTTYEGAVSEVQRTCRAVSLNGVRDWTTVRHAIVGDGGQLRGAAADADRVPIDELPVCDALLVDADGVEFDLLSNLSRRPRTIVVEHHPVPGDDGLEVEYDPDRLRRALRDNGYEIVSENELANHAGGGKYPEIVIAARLQAQ